MITDKGTQLWLNRVLRNEFIPQYKYILSCVPLEFIDVPTAKWLKFLSYCIKLFTDDEIFSLNYYIILNIFFIIIF